MAKYNKVDLHLTNLQLKKVADAVKNNNGTTIRLSNKNFNKNCRIVFNTKTNGKVN